MIFKTLDAKFRAIGWELLRLYTKQQPCLVGTRSIEMSEKVSERLTSDMLQRLVISQRLKERIEAKKDVKGETGKETKRLYETELGEVSPQSVATLLAELGLSNRVTDDEWTDWCLAQWDIAGTDKEHLLEALEHGIPHNVLNAKYHEREALIIAEAGRKGQITIATNMAGRGVDILLGGRVEDDLVKMSRDLKEDDGTEDEHGDSLTSHRRGGKERATPPLPLSDQERREKAEEVRALGGLYILGTERHESRRIDNQLRGRAGRQGDPGESKFFVALEDHLWKIFNANMMENPALKMWPPMEEVTAGFLSRMIAKTQERIENHFFEARKHTLEYDDVLNAQREHIYGLRREILLGRDVSGELTDYVKETIGQMIEDAWMIEGENGEESRVYDHGVLYEDLNELFPLVDYASIRDLEKHAPDGDLRDYLTGVALEAYGIKRKETGEAMPEMEKYAMLKAVNDRWMEHLQTIDYIREGHRPPRLRPGRSPRRLQARDVRHLPGDPARHPRGRREDGVPPPGPAQAYQPLPTLEYNLDEIDQSVPVEDKDALDGAATRSTTAVALAPRALEGIDWKRVSRNEPCPCGSGKKFKECHYKELREAGVI